MSFQIGKLSAADAAQLNQMQRTVQALDKINVAPPLGITRTNGTPIITAQTASGDLLAIITGNDAGTPPVHTAKRQTRKVMAVINTVVDYAPPTTFINVLNPAATVLPNGTLVDLVPILDFPEWYWAFPATNTTRQPIFARLTAVLAGLWKYQPLTLNGAGVWIDDGAATTTFTAAPADINGSIVATPTVGDRVLVMPSKQAGFQEFIVEPIASPLCNGLVRSINTADTIQGVTGTKVWQSRNYEGASPPVPGGSYVAATPSNDGAGTVTGLLEVRRNAGYAASPGSVPTTDNNDGGMACRAYVGSGVGFEDTLIALEFNNFTGFAPRSVAAISCPIGPLSIYISTNTGLWSYNGVTKSIAFLSDTGSGYDYPFFYWEDSGTTDYSTGLTVVGGTATFQYTFSRIGRIVYFQIVITAPGGGTTASVAGTTWFAPDGAAFPVGLSSTCHAVDSVTKASLGVGYIEAKSGLGFGMIWFPTWVATGHTIVVSGTYPYGS